MQVPVLELKEQYAGMKEEILAQINEVLDSQWVIGGPKVEELEKRIAELSDCKYGIGVSSGSDAILNVLMSLDIGAGDEVITTPFTFFATAGCIARTGAKPAFVDIDPKTYKVLKITEDDVEVIREKIRRMQPELELFIKTIS